MATKAERAHDLEIARESLGDIVPGQLVGTVLRHVSPSGMTRWIDVYTFDAEGPQYRSWSVAKLLGEQVNGTHDGIKVGGCGMDMGFHLVYGLGRRLFPDGFPCIGDRCPSNDHSNGHRDHTPGNVIHADGGYALRHRWI